MDQEQDVVGAAEVVAELAFRAAKLTEVDRQGGWQPMETRQRRPGWSGTSSSRP